MSAALPVCGSCGKPVEQGPNGWRHHLYDDYMGPCWWGKPGNPRIGGTDE